MQALWHGTSHNKKSIITPVIYSIQKRGSKLYQTCDYESRKYQILQVLLREFEFLCKFELVGGVVNFEGCRSVAVVCR